MATGVKRLENMSKHLTKKERLARADAEVATLPLRDECTLKAPAYIGRDNAAKRYWADTVERLTGLILVDDLDTEVLAIYCSKLSRRDSLNDLCMQLLKQAKQARLPEEEYLEAVDKLDSLMAKLQSLEQSILQYADKLGLTPAGRSRLALQRAAAVEVAAEEELFG